MVSSRETETGILLCSVWPGSFITRIEIKLQICGKGTGHVSLVLLECD
jgi:hypothetical protein